MSISSLCELSSLFTNTVLIHLYNIAHNDHRKSTLANRILEQTSTVESRDMEAQLLDIMNIER